MDAPEPTPTAYLDYLARCRQVFTPFAPIELPDFFAGRAHVIEDVCGELEAPGRQIAIYGERGVGKTSLAQLLYFFANYPDEQILTVRCLKGMDFQEICRLLLTATREREIPEERQTETSRSGDIRLGPVSGSASRKTTTTYRQSQDGEPITPSKMLGTFKATRGLLIIDEFDRVEDLETKTRMAEMIKHFSDARSKTRIMIVGVAETLTDLIGEHESLSRSLAQIGLDRMDEVELGDIITRGMARTGAQCNPSIATRIVRLADGFPHFVHLLALYSSIYAGDTLRDRPDAMVRISNREYHLGLKSAIAKSEHSLTEAYETAIVTTRRKSDIYELTLRAMALSQERDVQVRHLANQASYLSGNKLRPEKFSNALGELIKEERGRVLTKIRDGYYKFTNPLMRPYIRFLLEYQNLTERGGQFEFPFMKGSQ